jgi:Helix-turn-helix.
MFQISLTAARVNAELLQTEAAPKLGITAKTLRNYETGKTVIPAHIFRKAANLYGLPEELIRVPIVDDGKFDEDEKNLSDSTV